MFAESEDPTIKEIWNRKELANTSYGDCYETARKVYKGGHVRIDWVSALECSANLKYAKPDGTWLVQVDKEPGMINYALHFHKYSKKIKIK